MSIDGDRSSNVDFEDCGQCAEFEGSGICANCEADGKYCLECNGTGECSYCEGTGRRPVPAPDIEVTELETPEEFQ